MNYPENFKYKESYFEGSHTSYSWQSSKCNGNIVAKITGETNKFYIMAHITNGVRRIKKENIDFKNEN